MPTKIKNFIIISITAFIAYNAGIYFEDAKNINKLEEYQEIRQNNSSEFTNPLLECKTGPDYLSKNQRKPNKKNIEKIINDRINNKDISFASYYYRDLNNGPWLGINEREKFFPASLMKVPLAMYFLKKSEEVPNLLSSLVDSTSLNKETTTFVQYFKPQKTIDTNKSNTINELLESMLIYSDNYAAEVLVYLMEPDGLKKLIKDLNLEVSTSGTDDFITVRDYSSFFRILFNSSYINQANSEKLLNILSKTTFDSGITKYLPKKTIVSHKFGEKYSEDLQEKQVHDCGIVYLPYHPYLICIMARGYNIDKITETIALLSKETYAEVSK